jgi:chromosome segregation protein
LAEAETTREELAGVAAEQAGIQALDEEIAADRAALDDLRHQCETAERTRTETSDAEAATRDALQRAEETAATLKAEAQALTRFLQVGDSDLWPPLIDALTVAPGYEAALGSALGDDLTAPADEAAPVHWRSLGPLASPPPLPEGTQPLSNFVTGTTALTRRLSQIGIVPDNAAGSRLAALLAVGQRLVSTEGALWRWDGYTVTDADSSTARSRLESRNRLSDLDGEVTAAGARLAEARTSHDKVAAQARNAVETEQRLRSSARRNSA